MRDHQLTRLTDTELQRARRELAASLALARPDSPARVPILAHMNAIDAELAERAASGQPDELPELLIPDCRAGHTASRTAPQ